MTGYNHAAAAEPNHGLHKLFFILVILYSRYDGSRSMYGRRKAILLALPMLELEISGFNSTRLNTFVSFEKCVFNPIAFSNAFLEISGKLQVFKI